MPRAQEVKEGYDTEICFLDKSIDDDKISYSSPYFKFKCKQAIDASDAMIGHRRSWFLTRPAVNSAVNKIDI